MKAQRHTPLLAGIAALLPLCLHAQTPAAPEKSTTPPAATNPAAKPPGVPAPSPAPAPNSTITTTSGRSVLSSELKAGLRDSAPKYEEPKPAAPVAATEPDTPKNEIVRLPGLNVEAERPPIFRERDLYTAKDLSRIALRRYVGLNVTPFAFLNNLNAPIALEMYREEERLRNIQDLKDTSDAFARAGDKEGSEYIKAQSNSTFLRPPALGNYPRK